MEDKNKKSETAAHSPGRKSLIIALIVIAALLIAGILLYGSRKPAGEAAAQTGAVQSPAAPPRCSSRRSFCGRGFSPLLSLTIREPPVPRSPRPLLQPRCCALHPTTGHTLRIRPPSTG
jgi:hypothetical protein